ncbi:MAG: TlpA disulfide reductase family protein [Bacteroidia bacterium]
MRFENLGKKYLFVILCCFFSVPSFAAHKDLIRLLREGIWRGALTVNDSVEIPFTFSIAVVSGKHAGAYDKYQLTIINGEEKIVAENLQWSPDSVNWRMPVFDSHFKCVRANDSTFSGIWYNNSASKPYQLKFSAVYNKPRFAHPAIFKTPNWAGKYACTFSPGTADSSAAIGVFKQEGQKITGTFLTETGDYRFLEGSITDYTSFAVSCFDGTHAFLFKMKFDARRMLQGVFYSGKSWREPFTGIKNEKAELRDPTKLTWVKDSTNINFSFQDLWGKPVSLSDAKFQGKVVVIQILGSWCPNCMDETAWLSGVYDKYKTQGLEVIGLAYERSSDTAKANANIRRLKEKYHVNYTLLNTGKSGKAAASESLPFLNGIMSFPTTIYIDRKGKVRMVYTGFNGPATGAYYEKDTDEALRMIQRLLAEKN